MSLATIRTKVRALLGDNEITGYDLFTYGASSIFNISEDNINSVDSVFENDIEQGDSYWSYDTTNNRVTTLFSSIAGDTIQVNYTYFPNYSNSEITNYIQSALVHLSINNYYDYIYDATDDTIYPEVEGREENLIAMITNILINKPITSLKLPDVTINYPEKSSLEDKISKTISVFKHDSSGIFSIL